VTTTTAPDAANQVNLDIGGTFTDAYVVVDGTHVTGKSLTTHADLADGLLGAVSEAAGKLGRTVDDVLRSTDLLRYSTTVGTNALVERIGPRVGLIATAGQEDTIHVARSRSWADGMPLAVQLDRTRAQRPPDLVPGSLRVGVRERIDSEGEVILPLQEDDVLEALDHLVRQGVRAIAVCLGWSFMNAAHERRVRDIVRREYPDWTLGRCPVLLSSEVAPKLDEYRRSITTVISAFLAPTTEEHVIDLSDRLRSLGYRRPILMARNIGGVASASRTTALHLLGSGPVAGLSGAARVAREYGRDRVITADMGGTSFDVGLVLDGHDRNYEFDPVIDRWRVHLPVLANFSIGAGGGSIAYLSEAGDLRVGPRSAGSMPGPACYQQGGTEPTVTDADLVLGYIDPGYFLGGAMPLSERQARRALQRRLADPLGLDVDEAAQRVRRLIDGTMGQEIYRQTALKGYDPRDFTMFAFGGAGPVHACDVADYSDVTAIFTFPQGSEFNAFGVSTMQILQSYERTRMVELFDGDSLIADPEPFNAVVRELAELAQRDMAEEGFPAGSYSVRLELDMNYGGQHHTVRMHSPRMELHGRDDVEAVCDELNGVFAAIYGQGSVHPQGGIYVQLFRLVASVPAARPSELAQGRVGRPAEQAQKPSRSVWWRHPGEAIDTPVLERSHLPVGFAIEGPALLEDVDTVVAVSPGWRYELDGQSTGSLRRLD
jgi:N-methylhydantoinase A/oxoprolinase/acetone carboxylase beta subunit